MSNVFSAAAFEARRTAKQMADANAEVEMGAVESIVEFANRAWGPAEAVVKLRELHTAKVRMAVAEALEETQDRKGVLEMLDEMRVLVLQSPMNTEK